VYAGQIATTLSLAIRTPDGLAFVVGCSPPGIDKIVQTAAAIDPHVHIISGGFHLVLASDADIDTAESSLFLR